MVSWSDWGKTHYCTLWYRFISACQGVQLSPFFNFPTYLRSAGFAFVFDGASIAKHPPPRNHSGKGRQSDYRSNEWSPSFRFRELQTGTRVQRPGHSKY